MGRPVGLLLSPDIDPVPYFLGHIQNIFGIVLQIFLIEFTRCNLFQREISEGFEKTCTKNALLCVIV